MDQHFISKIETALFSQKGEVALMIMRLILHMKNKSYNKEITLRY